MAARSDASALVPAWVFLVLGVLCADVFVPRVPATVHYEGRDPPEAVDPGDLTRMNPRELRQLPGVGEGRARAIAAARWQHDRRAPPLVPDDVPGIGPVTESYIRTWRDSQPAPSIPLPRPDRVFLTATDQERVRAAADETVFDPIGEELGVARPPETGRIRSNP